MSNKILFIKCGSFSHINKSVEDELKRNFPKCTILVVDLLEIFSSLKLLRLLSLINVGFEYGLDFLLKKKSRYNYHAYELMTRFGQYYIKRYLEKLTVTNKNEYLFTFQTQSLFDASINDIPHFVYTDSTFLANKYYTGINLNRIKNSRFWMRNEVNIYKNAKEIFLFSTNQVNSIINQYGIDASKAKCVYAGSNSPFSLEDYKNKSYLKKNILFVGVNWERKGGDVLYKAFLNVLEDIPDAILTIVGCSPTINHPNIKIKGRIPLEAVEDEYKNATVFCLPTKREPFGIVFVEAMLRKLPIVASNIGAIPDMIENGTNGYLHNYADTIGFANSLKILLHDANLCEKMGVHSQKKALAKYTWDKVGVKIKDEINKKRKDRFGFVR